MLKNINLSSSLFFFFSLIQLSFAITQEWLFWPSPSNNGTIVVNSAENVSKIRNFRKNETLSLRYTITDEIEKFISAPQITLNDKVASIDMTYISNEMQFNRAFRMDRNFIPLFGTYETGLHIAITTKEDIKGKEVIQQFLEENCDFINQLFKESGYSLCRITDYVYFKNFIKMGQINPRYFYMFLSDFTLESMEGFSLYHIFKLNSKPNLELGCDFDEEAVSEWTSRYFNIVVSRHATMLNDKDEKDYDEEEKESTIMMKFEEILHLQFPETAECNVNQHLSQIKYIPKTVKTTNNAFSITMINPRGVKNDEIAFLPCPLPKIKFSYKLNPGVGLHPILFTTVEVNEWIENQPLVMLLTFDPNIFADEYQISDQKYPKDVRVDVLGHPDLEVAVNDPEAKFNYVKVVFDALAPKANITLEIPFHVRYPESEPATPEIIISNSTEIGQRIPEKVEVENEEDEKEKEDEDTLDPRLYKTIFIQPPRFYTTSTKLCHQDAYSSTNLPMNLLSNVGKKYNSNSKNNISIIPVRVAPQKSTPREETDKDTEYSSPIITPLRMDIPKGQLADYNKITFITTLITAFSIALIFLWILNYSKPPASETSSSSSKTKKVKEKNLKKN